MCFPSVTGGGSQEENVQRDNLLCASDLRGSSSAQLPIIQPVCLHCSIQKSAAGSLGPAVPPLPAPGTDQPGAHACSERLHRHLCTDLTHHD